MRREWDGVAEGIALLGVCVMIVLLERWLLMHDRDPNGRTSGLFAMREAEEAAKNSAAPAGAAANPPGPMWPPPARDSSLR